MSGPILVLNQNTKRESGRKVQLSNANAAKSIGDIIRTCLGPRSMLKMLMDPMGGIVMTNDGNAILREITVEHPAAKSLIEIARTQDEEVGDGTTSVVILTGEMMRQAVPFLEQQMHPVVVISAYRDALKDSVEALRKISVPVDVNDHQEMLKIVKSSLGTKFIKKWMDLACEIAISATKTVSTDDGRQREIDIKRYAKVEKVAGGAIEDSQVLSGVMINKDIVHHKMRRRIENPRILLLDCSLEYKKGESQTNIEITNDTDFDKILRLEEEYVKNLCDDVLKVNPDLVITEKGVSDLAQHFLVKAGVTVLRRVRKTDNNRIARACGAAIVNRTDEIKEENVGTGCGLFYVDKIGDEYYSYIVECKEPKACTILLRGASTDILKEVERNLNDAMQVARNIMLDPYLVPGGGAAELAVAKILEDNSKNITGVKQWPYKAVGKGLEIIPKTLIQNCGAQVIRVLTALKAKHASDSGTTWGVDGETGAIVDQNEFNIWEPFSVKVQTIKTAVETAILLLRVDDIVSGVKKPGAKEGEIHGPVEASEGPEA